MLLFSSIKIQLNKIYNSLKKSFKLKNHLKQNLNKRKIFHRAISLLTLQKTASKVSEPKLLEGLASVIEIKY